MALDSNRERCRNDRSGSRGGQLTPIAVKTVRATTSDAPTSTAPETSTDHAAPSAGTPHGGVSRPSTPSDGSAPVKASSSTARSRRCGCVYATVDEINSPEALPRHRYRPVAFAHPGRGRLVLGRVVPSHGVPHRRLVTALCGSPFTATTSPALATNPSWSKVASSRSMLREAVLTESAFRIRDVDDVENHHPPSPEGTFRGRAPHTNGLIRGSRLSRQLRSGRRSRPGRRRCTWCGRAVRPWSGSTR